VEGIYGSLLEYGSVEAAKASQRVQMIFQLSYCPTPASETETFSPNDPASIVIGAISERRGRTCGKD
jgi:hypothetical protein